MKKDIQERSKIKKDYLKSIKFVRKAEKYEREQSYLSKLRKFEKDIHDRDHGKDNKNIDSENPISAIENMSSELMQIYNKWD